MKRAAPRRAALLCSLATALGGCAGTRVQFVGDVESSAPNAPSRLFTTLSGTLANGRRVDRAEVQVDTRFQELGFDPRRRPLVVTAGERVVLSFADDEQAPNARLYISLAPELLKSRTVITEGEFIPYLDLHLSLPGPVAEPHLFTAICKGGRGRVSIELADLETVSGSMALVVTCRTYVDGYEREEADLALAGPFHIEG